MAANQVMGAALQTPGPHADQAEDRYAQGAHVALRQIFGAWNFAETRRKADHNVVAQPMHTAARAVRASLEHVKAPTIHVGLINHTCVRKISAVPNPAFGMYRVFK